MEFEEIKTEFDHLPIVLIDNSGSTSSQVFIENKNISILEYEMQIIKKILSDKEIDNFYLMFWNSSGKIYSSESVPTSKLGTIDIKPIGGTELSSALNCIPANWTNNKKILDVYILTDGEISDQSRISTGLNNLFQNNGRIYIITAEPNKVNYLTANCNAGNALYNAIRTNKLMGKVKSFESYNSFHKEAPFISFSNPDVAPECVPFRDKCFRKDKTCNFIPYLEELIINAKNDSELLKLAHDLSMTLHYLTKNKPLSMQKYTVNLFSDLFSDSGLIYKEIRALFLEEIDNHTKGMSTTFQAYKKNREKKFETAQLSLFENVKQSTSKISSINYVSLFVDSSDEKGNKVKYVIKSSDKDVNQSITLSDKTYNNSGIKLKNFTLPMLPCQIEMDYDMYDQCIRQWIRANYSKKYKLNPASDFIQYYFSGDILKVLLSNVSAETKQAYKSLAYVMMDRKRFGTDTTEFNYLLTNPPACVTNISEDKITYIFTKAMEHCNIKNTSPMTFWYAFIVALDDKVLAKAQLPFCVNDMEKDNVTSDTILNHINKNSDFVKEYIHSENYILYDYICYMSLEDISKQGGYAIPSHKLGSKHSCSPRFLLSKEAYVMHEKDNNIKCPICYTNLPFDTFNFIKSEQECIEEYEKLNKKEIINLNEIYYDSTKIEKVVIPKSMYDKEFDNDEESKLIEIDNCNFETSSYIIQSPYLQEAIASNTIEIRNQTEFNKTVFSRYPFLSDLDYTGVCLAGGFCRSIALRQRVKDLDFFFYGKDHNINFNRFLQQILKVIKGSNDKIKFLMMYKHQFNVFEVICVHDPNNFFTEDYKLDNFKQYDFKSIHRFDKYTIIDPETGIVYRKKKSSRSEYITLNRDVMKQAFIENIDFSNYFEDGDVTGIRMKYRLQFILTENNSISDLFKSFDLYPCRVAWDGTKTWFTAKSVFAYKYMVNVVNQNHYSDLFDSRLSKYFTYGFSIVLPEFDINKIKNKRAFVISKDLTFNINLVNDKQILVEHNSHIANKLESIDSLEQKNKDKGKALYKSALFCSLVSLLRYVKINDISYLFTNDIIVPDNNNQMNFAEKEEIIKFIPKINTRKEDVNWYKNYN